MSYAISKSFANSVETDVAKAVRSIDRFAFENKNIEKAQAHVRYLLDNVDGEVEDHIEGREARLWGRINMEVGSGEHELDGDLNDMFEAMEDLVEVVASGFSNGVFVTGPGGTGKTWTVNQVLESLGMEEGEDYISIKGFSTPRGLYEILKNNSDKLVIFDDCDSIFKDLAGLNILKAVLDTYPVRRVTWASQNGGDETSSFDFTGRIIFVSNEDPRTNKNQNFQAVMTRVLNILVGGSKEEIRDRMIQLLPAICKDLTVQDQSEISEFITENYKQINLSLRFIVHLAGLKQAKPDKWRKLAWLIKG